MKIRKTKKKELMDAVVVGNVDWAKARESAFSMAEKLNGEVEQLNDLVDLKDAYSPMAWMAICQQLRTVTDGMTVMRLTAEGMTTAQIGEATGISSGSIGAFRAWNTIYSKGINKSVRRRIKLKGKNPDEQLADLTFLRACGITLDVVAREVKSDE